MGFISLKKVILAGLTALLLLCASAEVFNAQVTADKLIVRSGPTASSALLGFVPKGEQVTVLAWQDGIAYIEMNGNYGYALVSQLNRLETTEEKLATVTASSAKVYVQPSDVCKKYVTVKSGMTFSVLSQDGEWVKLVNGISIGYIKLGNVKLTSKSQPEPVSTPKPTPVPTSAPFNGTAVNYKAKVVSDRMIVRNGPTAAGTQLGYLVKGQEFTVLAESSGIAYIELNGMRGYCMISDFAKVQAEPLKYDTATVISDTLKIYASPSTGSKVLCTVTKGSVFTLDEIGNEGKWAKLRNGSAVGYALVSGLSFTVNGTQPEADIKETVSIAALVTAKSSLYASASATSSTVGSVTAGTELTVLGYNNNWALVKSGSVKGCMPIGSLIKISDITMNEAINTPAYTKTKVNVYKYAATLSSYLGYLGADERVIVLANNDSWAYIDKNGRRGYCLLSGLNVSFTPTINKTESLPAVLTSAANMYSYASANSAVLSKLSANLGITVLGHNESWALVQYGSVQGYIEKSRIMLLSDITMAEKESYTALVTTGSTVYKYMYTASGSVGSCLKGWQVNVLAHNDTWALIELGGNKGYYPTAYLNIYYDEFVSPTVGTLYVTVINQSAHVYALALENAQMIGTLPIGTPVTVTAYTSKWARVTLNGNTGYALRSCLSGAAFTELKSGSTANSDVTKLQKALEELGYFDGNPAGNYGSLTASAVKRFQAQLGLTQNGEADINLLRVLYGGSAPESPIKSVTLQKGSKGDNVTRLQTRLTYKGYLSDSLDGDFGNNTEKAVKLFQKQTGMSETGIADTAVMRLLFSTAAPKCTSSPAGGGSSAGGGGTAGTGKYSTDADDDIMTGTASAKIETVIEYALAQLGKPYIYATSGPNSYDCSGLTCYCFKKVGVSLGRSAYAQGYNNVGTKITSISALQRGDIVCMNTLSDSDLSDHVGIYLGNGKMVHASSSAAKVIISPLNTGYYNRVFSWGRRVL